MARDQARAGSDVDVAVLRPAPVEHVLSSLPLDMESDLEKLLGTTVQVIDLRAAPVDLVHRVLRDGVLLVDRDPSARIQFEVRSRNEYFDLLPIYVATAGSRARRDRPRPHRQKLALIETYVRDLRVLRAQTRSCVTCARNASWSIPFKSRFRRQYDVASHIVSDERLGEPRTNRELFELLERSGWVQAELTARLGRMAGFRNLIVHGYAEVDPQIVKDVVLNHLGDLLEFVAVVRQRLGTSSP